MSLSKIDKRKLITLIINELEQELNQAINAANEAHAAAVDDQSVAETQYDTLAIEASYLAEGQSRRVQELQAAINNYRTLVLVNFDDSKAIALTALVQLYQDNQQKHWFFIGPCAGGFRCELANEKITVITPQSPMGYSLLEKYPQDDVEVKIGSKVLIDYIHQVQ